MSFIPRQPKKIREQITVKLDAELLGTLDSYARFIESSRDYIIAHALQFVFRKDRDFAEWHQTRPTVARKGRDQDQHDGTHVDGAISPDTQPHGRQRAARAAETPNGASA